MFHRIKAMLRNNILSHLCCTIAAMWSTSVIQYIMLRNIVQLVPPSTMLRNHVPKPAVLGNHAPQHICIIVILKQNIYKFVRIIKIKVEFKINVCSIINVLIYYFKMTTSFLKTHYFYPINFLKH